MDYKCRKCIKQATPLPLLLIRDSPLDFKSEPSHVGGQLTKFRLFTVEGTGAAHFVCLLSILKSNADQAFIIGKGGIWKERGQLWYETYVELVLCNLPSRLVFQNEL